MYWFVDWTPPESVSDGKQTHTKYIAYSYYITCGNTFKISVFCARMKNEWLGINLSKFYEKTCLWPIWSKFPPALDISMWDNMKISSHFSDILQFLGGLSLQLFFSFCTFNKIKTWQIYISHISYMIHYFTSLSSQMFLSNWLGKTFSHSNYWTCLRWPPLCRLSTVVSPTVKLGLYIE